MEARGQGAQHGAAPALFRRGPCSCGQGCAASTKALRSPSARPLSRCSLSPRITAAHAQISAAACSQAALAAAAATATAAAAVAAPSAHCCSARAAAPSGGQRGSSRGGGGSGACCSGA